MSPEWTFAPFCTPIGKGKSRKPMDRSVLYIFLATDYDPAQWFLFQGNSHGFPRGNHLNQLLKTLNYCF